MALLGVLFLGLFWLPGRPGESLEGPSPGIDTIGPRADDSPGPTLTDLYSAGGPVEVVSERNEAGADPRTSGPARYDGRGRIRGFIETDPDLQLPLDAAIVTGPSPFLTGMGTAEERRLELGGVAEFAIDDLALGGYRVWVDCSGANCTPLDVQLDRVNNDQYVVLRLSRAGQLEGSVVDANGSWVDGLPIVLEARPSGQRSEGASDASGRFVFERVRDGDYVLHFGHPDSPVAPQKRLSFQAPQLTLSPTEIPVLADFAVLVLDEYGAPVSGAELRGTGRRGGIVDGTTDIDGRVRARFLPPGRYRLHARHAELGAGLGIVVLEAGSNPELQIELTP